MNNEYIYLDHAAATPVSKKVLKVMEPYFSEQFFNPSAVYDPAIQIKRDYRQAKTGLGRLLGVQSGEIIITAGATESINLAFNIKDIKHVVTTAIEHQAVLNVATQYSHSLVRVPADGVVDPHTLKSAITNETTLVSVALVNNELGTVQPIKKISEIIQKVRQERENKGEKEPIYLHVDASQGASQLDLNVNRLGVDMMTVNAGKMGGPKQVGLLWAKGDIKIKPLIYGGGQERGLRGGTENVAGVIGFYEAFKQVESKRRNETMRLAKLRDYMQKKISSHFPKAIFIGNQKKRLTSFLHVSFPGLDGERLVYRLENRGVLVATGSACAANAHTRSHVLTALGIDDDVADGSLRITLGGLSNESDVKKATSILIEEVESEMNRVGND